MTGLIFFEEPGHPTLPDGPVSQFMEKYGSRYFFVFLFTFRAM